MKVLSKLFYNNFKVFSRNETEYLNELKFIYMLKNRYCQSDIYERKMKRRCI